VIATPATEPPSRSVSWRVFSVSPRALRSAVETRRVSSASPSGSVEESREPRAGVHKHVVGVVERGDDLPEPGGGGRRVRLEVRRAGDDAEAGRTCVNRVGDRPLPPARREG